VIEPDEQVFVFASNVSGAECFEGTCNAIGTILDDDGPPGIQINDISVSILSGLPHAATFTVSLSHTSNAQTTVHFATRDGTARAQTLTNFGQYFGISGTLIIPAFAPSNTISVNVLGTGGGTFFMDLSAATNGHIVKATGQCTIRIIQLTTGIFE